MGCPKDERKLGLLIDVISLIRKFRTEKRVFQKNGIEIIYVETSGPTQQKLEKVSEDIKGFACAKALSFSIPEKGNYTVYESSKFKVKMAFKI